MKMTGSSKFGIITERESACMRDVLAAVLRSDLTAFVHKVFTTVSPGDRYLHNWHIEAIAYQLKRCIEGESQRLLITRRVFARFFLFRPDPEMNQAFLYCLAVAAEKFGIIVHAACLMSTHLHLVITDVRGEHPRFTTNDVFFLIYQDWNHAPETI